MMPTAFFRFALTVWWTQRLLWKQYTVCSRVHPSLDRLPPVSPHTKHTISDHLKRCHFRAHLQFTLYFLTWLSVAKMAKVYFTAQNTFEKHTGYLFWMTVSFQSSWTDQLSNSTHPFFTPVLVMSVLGFKVRVDPLLAWFVACKQWIPQIRLLCNTC